MAFGLDKSVPLSLRATGLLCCAMILHAQTGTGNGSCIAGGSHYQNRFEFAVDAANGKALMRALHGSSHSDVAIPGIVSGIKEFCPLVDGKFLVVGTAGRDLYNLVIVDEDRGHIVDAFYGWAFAVSPNGRWIIRTKFFPASSDGSAEYLLYDSNSSPEGNRAPGVPAAEMDAVGKPVYPASTRHWAFENVGLPSELTHFLRSRAIYWSSDSRAFTFADSADNALSVVLVQIGEETTDAYVHLVRSAEVCSGPAVDVSDLTLADAKVAGTSADREIVAGFTSSAASCQPRELRLSAADFVPAPLEKLPQRTLKPSRPASMSPP